MRISLFLVEIIVFSYFYTINCSVKNDHSPEMIEHIFDDYYTESFHWDPQIVNQQCNGKQEEGCNVRISEKNPRRKASNLAKQAAQEAAAASTAQNWAAKIAAKLVRAQLAEKAVEAAHAAAAVVANKQLLIEQLENEVHEAEAESLKASESMSIAENNVNKAVRASEEAQDRLKMLTEAIRTANADLNYVESVANCAQIEIIENEKLVETTRQHIKQLKTQYDKAKADYDKTKEEACKAVCAAETAKRNIQRIRRTPRQEQLIKTFKASFNV